MPVEGAGEVAGRFEVMRDKPKPRDERWGSYPETVCYFQGETEVMVDLREEVAPQVRKGLSALGLGEPFGVVTAYNPRGVDHSDEENKRRAAELEAELRSVGYRFVPVDCCSPDKEHCEYSVAVVAPLETVLDMARRFEQIAIFWFDGSSFSLVGAISPGELKLPL
jgi:Protein of unknown function (DUF3293)